MNRAQGRAEEEAASHLYVVAMKLISYLSLFLPAILLGQKLPQSEADNFVRFLISGNDSILLYVDRSALAVSQRLGVTYEGIQHKFLISYDIDDAIKAKIRVGAIRHHYSLDEAGDDFQLLTLRFDNSIDSRTFYFRQGRLTSPLVFHSLHWTTLETRFFRFVLSDTSLTNRYAMNALENFVIQTATTLNVSEAELQTLEAQKILYYLCSDEEEIQSLTGFKSRGMLNLAYDAIVSTYNSHFHELAHLLINFKLKTVPLFVHPFLQEGFAVALGGRGGIGVNVAMGIGAFLEESGGLGHNDLLKKDTFVEAHPSLSYPVSGVYNRFLLEVLGGEHYLELYRAHCGQSDDSSVRSITDSELPDSNEWQSFLKVFRSRPQIDINSPVNTPEPFYHSDTIAVSITNSHYVFQMRSSFLFGSADANTSYRSKKFKELFPEVLYAGFQYALVADSLSVSLYDLFRNELVEGYVASFSLNQTTVPRNNDFYCFSIPIAVFPEQLDVMLVKNQ